MLRRELLPRLRPATEAFAPHVHPTQVHKLYGQRVSLDMQRRAFAVLSLTRPLRALKSKATSSEESPQDPQEDGNFMRYSDMNRVAVMDTSLTRTVIPLATKSRRSLPAGQTNARNEGDGEAQEASRTSVDGENKEDGDLDVEAGESEELPSVLRTPAERRRQREAFFHAQKLSPAQKARAQAQMERAMSLAKMEDPAALEYPLHTYHDIPPSVYRSVAAHDYVFEYVSMRDDVLMRKHFIDKEDGYKTEVLGKAFYLRVVNVADQGDAAGLPHRETRGASPKPSYVAEMHQRLLDEVRRVVLDYAKVCIQPFPNELAFDVSHYAATAPYVAAARANVEQFVKDARDVIEKGTISREGRPGTVTSVRHMQPLAPEEVAKEVAARISREVLKPLADTKDVHPTKGKRALTDVARQDAYQGFRVCLGIAATPALAKIACDAEVLSVKKNPAAGTSKAPVRVRSFYHHIRTLRDSKNFMAPFRVAHVPVFTPAFVRLLREVFHIDTCADLYEKREALFFNLSLETFDVCYDAAFGRMRFPAERGHALHCADNIRKTVGALEAFATNAIAIANASRTAVRGSYMSISRQTINGSILASIDARLNYGRLFTDEQFIELALKTAQKTVERLHRKGFTASGMRMDVRKGLDVQFVVARHFPATNSYAEIMRIAREAAMVLAPRRQHKGPESTGDYFCVNCTLTGLDLAVMIPDRLAAEVDALKKAYLDARDAIGGSRMKQPRTQRAEGGVSTRGSTTVMHRPFKRRRRRGKAPEDVSDAAASPSHEAPTRVIKRPGVRMGRPKKDAAALVGSYAKQPTRRELRLQRQAKERATEGGSGTKSTSGSMSQSAVDVDAVFIL